MAWGRRHSHSQHQAVDMKPTLCTCGRHTDSLVVCDHESTEPDHAQVATAGAFLKLAPPLGKATLGSARSGLARTAGRWGRHNDLEPHTSNGALLKTAINLRHSIRPDGGKSPNARIGISWRATCAASSPTVPELQQVCL